MNVGFNSPRIARRPGRTIRNMRSILCGLFLTGFCLFGQSTHEDTSTLSRLNLTLTGLQNAGAGRLSLAHQLVDVMLSVGEGDRRPSRSTIEVFADEFVGALIGRSFTKDQLSMLQRSIMEVLRGSTTNLNSASHLREPLAALHVDSSRMQAITKRFLAIGEEVRGPDDSPLIGDK